MKVQYAQTMINIQGRSVFLAGPTPRSEDVPSWRPIAISMFEEAGFKGTILIPELEGGWNREFAYKSQIEWELDAMKKADIILFWVPRHLETMPAFTTNTEFGYWLAKDPRKMRVGIPDTAVKCDYIKYLSEVNNIKVHKYLSDLIESIVSED